MTLTYRYHDEMLKALKSDHDHKFIFTKGRRTGFNFLTKNYINKFAEENKMQQRTRTFVASPFRGDVEVNQAYLIECMQDSIDRGEAPFAPHMMYTQVLDDDKDDEREAGINCGIAFMGVCDKVAIYYDNGVSEGMHHEIKKAYELGLEVEFRKVPTGGVFHGGLNTFPLKEGEPVSLSWKRSIVKQPAKDEDLQITPEEEVTNLIKNGDAATVKIQTSDEILQTTPLDMTGWTEVYAPNMGKNVMVNKRTTTAVQVNETTKIGTVDKSLKVAARRWLENRDEWGMGSLGLGQDRYIIKEIEDDGATIKLHFEQSHHGFMPHDLVMCQGCKYRVSSLLNVGWTYKQIADECKLVVDRNKDTD